MLLGPTPWNANGTLFIEEQDPHAECCLGLPLGMRTEHFLYENKILTLNAAWAYTLECQRNTFYRRTRSSRCMLPGPTPWNAQGTFFIGEQDPQAVCCLGLHIGVPREHFLQENKILTPYAACACAYTLECPGNTFYRRTRSSRCMLHGPTPWSAQGTLFIGEQDPHAVCCLGLHLGVLREQFLQENKILMLNDAWVYTLDCAGNFFLYENEILTMNAAWGLGPKLGVRRE